MAETLNPGPPAPVEPTPEELLVADDPDELDEGYAASDRSSLTSIASQIRKGIIENGRLYAAYGKGEYGMPQDDKEMDRIDMAHAKYFLLLNERHFLAPIPSRPQDILDLGTGTGIWSIDVSEQYPAAYVKGIDIAPIQPSLVPPNCTFELDDVENDWTFRREFFDFIFARDLISAIRDWPRLIDQCYQHLRPGGWLELESIYGVLNCDDGSLPEEGSFRQFDKLVQEAAIAFKTPLTDPGKWEEQMETAGFKNITWKRFKIPCNPWPKDKRLKTVGARERVNFLEGLEGMSMRLFQKGLGWTPEETQVLLAKVRSEVNNPRYHSYYSFYVVYAQKPLEHQ